ESRTAPADLVRTCTRGLPRRSRLLFASASVRSQRLAVKFVGSSALCESQSTVSRQKSALVGHRGSNVHCRPFCASLHRLHATLDNTLLASVESHSLALRGCHRKSTPVRGQ